MSLLGISILVIELIVSMKSIYIERAHDYTSNKLFYDENEMSNFNITLGKFNNSLNFAFGL